MIPEPHGGRLIDRSVSEGESARRDSELADLTPLTPFVDQRYDAEKIGVGAYSPLEGFMGSEAYRSVLDSRRLPGGLPWTIPILLAPSTAEDRRTAAALKAGDEVALLDGEGRMFSLLHVEEKFAIDRGEIAERVYGTKDPSHPNVADLDRLGEVALGGKIDRIHPLPLPAAEFELTPAESRRTFAQRGWKNVAAYQCRNPPHTAHEYLQRLTLEREDVDALFIQPVVGRLKKGDYRPEVILRAYRALVGAYYSPERVLLGSLSITMRYAGPNAALFLAIVRKNYGCGAYIVGRDQAGVGNFYDPYAAHRIFDELPIGITPLRYEETFYCRACQGMATRKSCAHPDAEHLNASQTLIRNKLSAGEPIPPEIVRPEVARILSEPNVTLTE